jgi:hypothetical protein
VQFATFVLCFARTRVTRFDAGVQLRINPHWTCFDAIGAHRGD